MKKLAVFLACFVMLFCTSCSLFEEDGSGHVFKISLTSDPKNLDPQLAEDLSSISVAENLFARLIKSNVDGSLKPWVAEDYEISDDGMSYTFYINNEFKWRAAGGFSANLTAHDFVFALRRMFDPETESPHAEKYYCIKNSVAVNKGYMDAVDLGVYAKDDYTLVIDLDYPNANFLYLMSLLPSSPCNEEFFDSCKGKYGLEDDCIASNGPFYVRYWMHEKYSTDNYVRLTRNADYSAISRVYPSGITYLINKNDVKLKNFTSQATDILVLNDFVTPTNESDYTVEELNYGTFGLVFNEYNELFARTDVRALFSMSINRDTLYEKSGDILEKGYTLYPNGLNILGSSLLYENSDIFSYDKDMAEYRWNFLLTQEQKNSLHSKSILVPDIFSEYDCLRTITDNWNRLLGIPFGIEVVNMDDFEKRVSEGAFDILLLPLTSESGNPIDYISLFGENSTFGYTVDEVVNAVGSSENIESISSYVYDCLEAQRAILEEYHYIPLFEMPLRCYYDSDICDLVINPYNGAVIFENAKYY